MASLLSRRGGYVVSAALVVAGIVVGVLGVVRLVGSVEGMPRAVMPGKASVELPAGDSSVFLETRTVVDGVAMSGTDPGAVRCLIEGTVDDPVLVIPTHHVTYAMGSYEGRLVLEIEHARAGVHTVSCESAGGSFVLAFASGPLSSIGSRLLIVMLSSTALVLAGLTLGGVVWYRRSSGRRRAGPPLGAAGLSVS